MRVTAVEVPTRVLVFGMTRPDGSIDAAELYDVAAACGQTSEQVRSCLRRLLTEGLVERDGNGRTATFRTTEAGDVVRLGSLRRHELAYRQDRRGQGWDGRWHLAAFAIPEHKRAARDRLRDRLLDAGGAAVNNGLYVSPHGWEDEVRGIAERLDVVDRLSLASTDDLEVGGVRTARELARALWPIDELAASYASFVAAHGHVVPTLERLRERHDRISDADFLPGALQMVIAFQEVFLRDPLLPPGLLPRPWPGRAARELLVTSRRLALRLRAEHE
ncbi:MAG TPA: PaaX family transcriptional regulator C-terminal domain-containing protein, partial [Aquihabitans sp.]|nr:PaaX family transcriptional regulator C-terminal domain-containing protein [Aquihabitans sp.]